ncbi:strictosidine synthase [Streptomyces sp. WI04-05B]|uniref:strictosidine synthase n=1 Tax=Streptomyces TaxID=1883 RepID=UPI0029A0203C|nr:MULTISPECIES: strictosidine synthase [unclassified Streptomyces]MDX2543652.1 strictosidine synthase [Streptomyces sp. WI04-05B]MDX2582860.1 strictosidine synthase [Streptomyces sp. WI04-05A]
MSTSPAPAVAPLEVKKHLTSSILLWVRTDQPRQTGMDHWKGPHSGIISATPGLEEYRQIHLAEHNTGRWPAVDGVETAIPADRKIDGVAEVTFQSALAPLKGREQTKLAYADEINVFRRTLLYAGPPNSSRWYDVAGPGETVGARTLVYLRRRDGVGAGAFRKFVNEQLAPALAGTGVLKELRTQTFLPWIEKLWDTPNVAHDNPQDQRFHASVSLGFTDTAARDAFFTGHVIEDLSNRLAPRVSAIHAYDVTAALTYVKNGGILPHYEE